MVIPLFQCRGYIVVVPLIQRRGQLTIESNAPDQFQQREMAGASLEALLSVWLQSAQRDQTTVEIVDKLASLNETAQADNLRARAVAHVSDR